MNTDLQSVLARIDHFLIARPDHTEVLIERAHVLAKLGRREEALACAKRAVCTGSRSAQAFNMRGMILDSFERHEEALADFEVALSLQPGLPDAINNRGIHYSRAGEFEQALACYERSLALEPNQPQTVYNRAMALLALGDWRPGLREFESRWQVFPQEARRLNRLAPVWRGEANISGKTILLHHEQGYGDTLQFSRYVPLVAALGARVIVAVPAALRSLMSTLPGAPQIVSEREPIPPHDYCCSLMSLPLIFGTTPDNVPALTPYLAADAAATRSWGERLGQLGRPRIGLVWGGRRYLPINYPRDMPLELLQPLLGVDAHFICLQQGLTEPERTLLAGRPNVSCHGEELRDFADTAALIANLDLVISVDTAVAHLAGALGKTVWLMNRYASCWRWLQKRPDSPWYPTLRQFRQPSPGDWKSVVQSVTQAAIALVARSRSPGSMPRAAASPPELLARMQSALEQHRRGDLRSAIEQYRAVLSWQPRQPEALHLLGVALAQGGQHLAALESLSWALELQPRNVSVLTHLGNALAGLGRHEEAIVRYEQALALDGGLADAHYNKGVAQAVLERHDAALVSYRCALALRPDYPQVFNNLGSTLLDLDRLPEALDAYEQAIRIQPDMVDAWINRAIALKRLHRYEESLTCTQRALELAPQHAEAHSAHGATLAALGRDDEALLSFQSALRIRPGLADALWNQAIAQLSQGRLREGWLHYEARWRVRSLGLKHLFSDQPAWLGHEPVRGKTILLHAEQGYGDTLQFCRYATLVAEQGARVMLGVPSGLARLMRSVRGVDLVVTQGTVPPFDLHCPLLSLPLALGTELSSIPAPLPYLYPDPAERARWAARLAACSGPKVGLVWAGRSTHSNDANRSLPLDLFQPLITTGASYICLQKELRAGDAAVLEQIPRIQRWGEELADFADAAALVAELDLVITVDTAIAHLAGALGRPVWILLPRVADWRWLQERPDSPWYPSARLFRQWGAVGWRPVIERVREELSQFVSSYLTR